MSSLAISLLDDLLPDDSKIVDYAQWLLNAVTPIGFDIIPKGRLIFTDTDKVHLQEISFHWADGHREVVMSVGGVPTMFHKLLEDYPLVSGLYGNYLNQARRLTVTTPKLWNLLDYITRCLGDLHYAPMSVIGGSGFTEIPVAVTNNSSHFLSYISLAELELGQLGIADDIVHH